MAKAKLVETDDPMLLTQVNQSSTSLSGNLISYFANVVDVAVVVAAAGCFCFEDITHFSTLSSIVAGIIS